MVNFSHVQVNDPFKLVYILGKREVHPDLNFPSEMRIKYFFLLNNMVKVKRTNVMYKYTTALCTTCSL